LLRKSYQGKTKKIKKAQRQKQKRTKIQTKTPHTLHI